MNVWIRSHQTLSAEGAFKIVKFLYENFYKYANRLIDIMAYIYCIIQFKLSFWLIPFVILYTKNPHRIPQATYHFKFVFEWKNVKPSKHDI